MKFRNYASLLFINLIIISILVWIQSIPGYMDADYYYASALRLFEGHGFTEIILWNYLDNPAGLPHPSHVYWMPLVSLVGASGMLLLGTDGYIAARLGLVLMAVCVPVLVAYFSYQITSNVKYAYLSGLLATFSGFYLPYITHTDSFALVMMIGLAFFWLIHEMQKQHNEKKLPILAMGLGVASGLMHLSRADGVLWFFVSLLYLFWCWLKRKSKDQIPWFVGLFFSVLLGYLLVMGPWFWRNLQLFDSPFAPGNLKTLWITNYDELYSYPGSLLTPQRWMASGWEKIIKDRLWALGLNLQSLLAVQGEVFLFPFMLVGLWSYRKKSFVQVAILLWSLLFLLMSVVFPYAGARGGFFHSGSALQPLAWVMAPIGLDIVLEWAAKKRGWNIHQSRQVFYPALVGMAILLSLIILLGIRIDQTQSFLAWGNRHHLYVQAETVLQKSGANQEDIVMVNNPPGFYNANRRPAISIPYGDNSVLLEVAQRYQAKYLLLEFNQLLGSVDVYQNPSAVQQLNYLGKIGEVQIYKIETEDQSP